MEITKSTSGGILKKPGMVLLSLVGAAVMVAGLIFPVAGLVVGLRDLEHYDRVRQNPLSVVAVVTKHTEHTDSESGDSYYSHISYSVDGVKYQDITYEKYGDKADLTPVGVTVTVDVSPEDPARTLKDLRDSSAMTFFCILFICCILDAVVSSVLLSRHSKKVHGTPDTETVEKDLRLASLARIRTGFCLPASVAYWCCYLRYSAFLAQWFIVFPVLSTGLLVLCLVLTVKRLRAISAQRYRMSRDVLVKKESDYDSDSGTTYKLHFRADTGTQWEKKTNKNTYNAMHEGNTVLAVYLEGKKKPLISYDCDGTAS